MREICYRVVAHTAADAQASALRTSLPWAEYASLMQLTNTVHGLAGPRGLSERRDWVPGLCKGRGSKDGIAASHRQPATITIATRMRGCDAVGSKPPYTAQRLDSSSGVAIPPSCASLCGGRIAGAITVAMNPKAIASTSQSTAQRLANFGWCKWAPCSGDNATLSTRNKIVGQVLSQLILKDPSSIEPLKANSFKHLRKDYLRFV